MKLFFILTFIVLFGYQATAQTILPRFENLGVNEGLAHSSVYSILQDKRGFMWFGTPAGLSRYDGDQIISYQYNGPESKLRANNFVRGEMIEDKDSNIWFANENGIYKWDAILEEIILVWKPDPTKLISSQFRPFYLDKNNILWLVNTSKGIAKYSISNQTIEFIPFPSNLHFSLPFQITSDDRGMVWFCIEGGNPALISFTSQSGRFSEVPINSNPYTVLFQNHQPLFADKEGLIKYNPETKKKEKIFFPKDIKEENLRFMQCLVDEDHRWWLTTQNGGLLCYNEKKGTFTIYRHDILKLNSLPFNITTCLYIDHTNNLWIGTDGGGVAKLNLKEPKFNLFPQSEGSFPVLKDYFTKCFFEDSIGRIWFGTFTNGLNIYDPISGSLKNYQKQAGNKKSLPGNVVGAILKDRDGNMWIGCSEGVSIFDEKRQSFSSIVIKGLSTQLLFGGSFIFKMTQIKNGDILCATNYGLLRIRKNKNGQFSGELWKQPYLSTNATDVVEMDDGMVFLARPGVGLLQLKNNDGTYERVNEFFPGIDLRSTSIDEKNRDYLWIGSGIGLIHFNTKSHTYQLYNKQNGLADNYVYGELQDSLGNLWISTNKGLSFLNIQSKVFENYSYLNGLQSNEFNTQAFHKGASGIFYFGGIKGFNWFKPNSIAVEKTKPLVAITRLEINNVKLIRDSNYIIHRKLSVPYNKNYFTFQFSAIDFTMPKANKVKYILEGWDADYITTENKTARYANLPPGEYVLKVKASNEDGIWSNEKILNITISPPFWQRPLFYFFSVLLFVFAVGYIIYIIIRRKVKRKMQLLEKQIAIDSERLRIGADMHDEIGSSITHIALMSELMQKQPATEIKTRNDLKTISASAHKILQTMSDIIWALNPQNDQLENLLAYIREQSQQTFEPFDFHFKINFPDSVPDIKLNNEAKRNLYLVTKELLNNAIKHSGASHICLQFEILNHSLCFTVSDDGKGFYENEVRTGSHGIINLKKRMKDIGGEISWINGKPGMQARYWLALK